MFFALFNSRMHHSLEMLPLIVTIKDDISLTVILNSSHAQITKRLYNSLAFGFIFFKEQI
jgi:hypothetical protein